MRRAGFSELVRLTRLLELIRPVAPLGTPSGLPLGFLVLPSHRARWNACGWLPGLGSLLRFQISEWTYPFQARVMVPLG